MSLQNEWIGELDELVGVNVAQARDLVLGYATAAVAAEPITNTQEADVRVSRSQSSAVIISSVIDAVNGASQIG